MEAARNLLDETIIEKISPVVEKKSSSTNSYYIGSTMMHPSVKSIIRTASVFLYDKIRKGPGDSAILWTRPDYCWFSEQKYVILNPEEATVLPGVLPEKEEISKFLMALLETADFSPECIMVSLIYVSRLEVRAELQLTPSNWRPIIFMALLIAQKIWDDRYLSNGDFALIYPFFTKEEVNRLERKFLELIQYDVTVGVTLYAKYYYELRTFDKDNPEEFPLRPLDTKEEYRLEVRSAKYSEALQKIVEERKRLSLTGGAQKGTDLLKQ